MWLANAPPRICFCHASQNKSVPGIFAGISRSLVRRIQTNEWMNERYLMHHLYLMSVPLLWLDISHQSGLLNLKQKEVNVIELKSLESLWAIHLLSELSSSLWKLKQEVILFRRRNFTQGAGSVHEIPWRKLPDPHCLDHWIYPEPVFCFVFRLQNNFHTQSNVSNSCPQEKTWSVKMSFNIIGHNLVRMVGVSLPIFFFFLGVWCKPCV